MAIAVEIKSLEKSFENGETKTEVLKGVNLECHTAEILMIVGPSGCGKTTLLSCIAGTLKIDRGHVVVFEEALEQLTEDQILEFRKKNIGFIFQQFNLIPTLTLIENVSIPLLLNSVDEEKALQESEKILERVGLRELKDRYPSQVSGGQQQRVAIARALVHDPKLIICDEPTSSLDGKTGHAVVQLLREIVVEHHRTVIIVTHDSRIFEFAHRIAEMEDGRVKNVYLDPQQFIRKSW